ncbi:hypothetical protein OG792_23235 [Micromonospora sp. NBC_01699]|uniref:hypothetical protein n=1 Tax=Micromonospora sp. NBC_01699 TaxID=2975984 RepID=UPI002E2CDC5A|nr:hypothetical protein [Micromonospora sp. NBC_01699]
MYLIQSTTQNPSPIFLVHDSGKVRHIGPVEFNYLRSLGGGATVPLLVESDADAFSRLLAEARVSQGYLQN